MDDTRVETRLHVEDDLDAGREVGLDHGRSHFLRSVLRLSRGAHVAVFNARDGEWLARIDGLGKGWCWPSSVQSRPGRDGTMRLYVSPSAVHNASRIQFECAK